MLVLLLACTLPGMPTPAPSTPPPTAPTTSAPTPSPAGVMEELADHSASLYFAGMGGDTELKAFEIEELEEAIDGLAGLEHKGTQLQPLARELLPPALARVKAADTTGFAIAYDELIAACNSCHSQTGVAFIHIIKPRTPPWSNVQYTYVPPRPGMGGGGGPGAGMGPGARANAPDAGADAGERPVRGDGKGPRAGGRPGGRQRPPTEP